MRTIALTTDNSMYIPFWHPVAMHPLPRRHDAVSREVESSARSKMLQITAPLIHIGRVQEGAVGILITSRPGEQN